MQTVFAMQIKHAFVRTVGAHELATAQNDTTQNDTDMVCIWLTCELSQQHGPEISGDADLSL